MLVAFRFDPAATKDTATESISASVRGLPVRVMARAASPADPSDTSASVPTKASVAREETAFASISEIPARPPTAAPLAVAVALAAASRA